MFDIGWQELFIVTVLAIIIIGPKDLPRAIRTITVWIRKARGLARDFQSNIDEVVREVELDELKKDVGKLTDGNSIQKALEEELDPTGELEDDLDMSDIQDDLDSAIDGLEEDRLDNDADPMIPEHLQESAEEVDTAEAAPADSDTAQADTPDEASAKKADG